MTDEYALDMICKLLTWEPVNKFDSFECLVHGKKLSL